MAEVDCPRCGTEKVKSTGTRTERWGCVREFKGFECLFCNYRFEKEL